MARDGARPHQRDDTKDRGLCFIAVAMSSREIPWATSPTASLRNPSAGLTRSTCPTSVDNIARLAPTALKIAAVSANDTRPHVHEDEAQLDVGSGGGQLF